MPTTHIVPIGGGLGKPRPDKVSGGWQRLLLSLSPATKPVVCYIGTASGDDHRGWEFFQSEWDGFDVELRQLTLFTRNTEDIPGFMADVDIVFVGGGNTKNMLAIWDIHGVTEVLESLRDTRDMVFAGSSAGGNCWFEACSTDSFGPSMSLMPEGLGWLTSSYCPHYDGEPHRQRMFSEGIREGAIPAGFASDEATGLVFRDSGTGFELVDSATVVPGGRNYRVGTHGQVDTLETRLLG